MVKILYGVCGEGLGHASRSRILIKYLKKNHDIRIVAGGKAHSFLSKDFDYVYEIESPRFVYKGDEVRLFYSILKMLYRTFVGTIPSFFRIRRLIKEFKPDIVITDADPISSYAALIYKIPRLSIDNPSALLHRKYNVELGEFFSWLPLIIAMKIATFSIPRSIIYDFFDEPAKDKRVTFFKPLIQEGLLNKKTKYGDHVFVYQTSISTGYILDVLKQFDETFIIYGFNKEQTDGNLIFRCFNESDFYKDLTTSKAVIVNGGFTVISEALALKKPVLSLPIKQQFEQILNGKFVERLGAGIYHMHLDKKILKSFFDNLEKYKENLKAYDPGDQKDTLKQIDAVIQTLVSAS